MKSDFHYFLRIVRSKQQAPNLLIFRIDKIEFVYFDKISSNSRRTPFGHILKTFTLKTQVLQGTQKESINKNIQFSRSVKKLFIKKYSTVYIHLAY